MVPESERNVWQKIAAKTRGVVTPGNAVSLTGAVLVGAGLRDIAKNNKTRGTILLGLGRLLDLGDGTVAELTGTKSSIGEGMDAVIDKAEIAIGLPILVANDMLPLDRAMTIGVQNLSSAFLTGVAKVRGAEIHPSRSGKDWTMGCWMTVGSHCVEGAAQEEGVEAVAVVAKAGADMFFHATAGLGWTATSQYAQDAMA